MPLLPQRNRAAQRVMTPTWWRTHAQLLGVVLVCTAIVAALAGVIALGNLGASASRSTSVPQTSQNDGSLGVTATTTATAQPGSTPQSTGTPNAGATPAATSTPRPAESPAATAVPTNTPVPTATPKIFVTITCASLSAANGGDICVHTLPGASLEITAEYCKDGAGYDTLDDVADGQGNLEWVWDIDTTCTLTSTATVFIVAHTGSQIVTTTEDVTIG